MNVNTTSTYTYGSSASKGMSGLASGLDTESLVKEMLSGTQSKIDAQKALKQQTEWKQEIYRDLIGSINSFQSKYFQLSSPTSLTASSFYNTMSVNSSSKNFTVTASSGAAVGNTSIQVHQLAANHSLSSSGAVSGRLRGSMDQNALQKLADAQLTGSRVLELNVTTAKGATSTVSINLSRYFKAADGSLLAEVDAEGIAGAIQGQLRAAGIADAAVSMDGGQLSIKTRDVDSSFSVGSGSSALALKALGLTAGATAQANSSQSQRALTGKTSLTPSIDFEMTLDGSQKKTISLKLGEILDEDRQVDQGRLTQALTKALDEQFGAGAVQVERNGTGLEFVTPIAGRKVMVTNGSDAAVLKALGFENGQSNRIDLYTSLNDLYFTTPLQGDQFKFSINGAQFTFSGEDDIGDIIANINNSEAGVTITYKPLDDTFTMTVNDAGAGHTVRMEQTEGNLLSVMFGAAYGDLKGSGKASSAAVTRGQMTAEADPNLEELRGGTLALEVNGKSYELSLRQRAAGSSAYTKEELIEALNTQLRDTFGMTVADGEEKQNLELRAGAEGKMELLVRDNSAVRFAGSRTSDPDKLAELGKGGNLAAALGFAAGDGLQNVIGGSMTLKDAGLADLAAKLKALGADVEETDTLDSLAEKTKNADVRVSFEDGRLTVSSDKEQDFAFGGDETMKLLFGTAKLALNQPVGGKAVVTEGRNAVVSINGMLTERSSNTFTYDGLTIELKGLSPAAEGAGEAAGAVYQGGVDVSKYVPPVPGSWVDSNGYLRSAEGKYLSAKDKTTEVSSPAQAAQMAKGGRENYVEADWEVTEDRSSAVRYTGLVYQDANGNRVNGVGINAGGSLVDSSGRALKAREEESFTTSRDVDKIVEGIKGFIDEYNTLVKTISDYLNEDADYREYAPLTDEQRAEMSEKQIELWEEKAKTGLLRRDSILQGFLQSMRSIWYETNSSGYAIYQLGIETGEWQTRGQLTLSVDGEATLRQMLASDPTGVMNFFANAQDGAAARVNTVIKEVANTSSGSPGSLVQLAGIKGRASETDNTLYEQLKKIDERIERLTDQYEQEKDRYWNQFNTMEQLISNMNTQSAWLAQQFSY